MALLVNLIKSRKVSSRLLCLCLFLSLPGQVIVAQTNASPSQDQNAIRQAKLNELKATINQLKIQLDKVKNSRSQLQSKLEAEEKNISELNNKVKSLKKALKEKQSSLQNLRNDRRASQVAKAEQQGSVVQQINASYRLGKQSTIKLILNQSDPAHITRNLKYYDYLIKDRAERINTYTEAVNTLNALEPKIESEQLALKKNQKRLKLKRTELVSSQDSRKKTLRKLEAAIANKDRELDVLEQDRKDLESLVKRVVHVIGDIEAPINNQAISKLKGKLPWPVKGSVRHKYGSTRIRGKVKWQGMMIGANKGENIRAVHHGRVVFSDYLRGYGLLLIIDHGSGFLSLYAHNESLYKTLGEWVDVKDVIATVGDTGGLNKTGLYFELRYKGSPTNPHRWLRRRA